MMHKCGWCGHIARANSTTNAANVSHGICATCLAEMLQEVYGLGRTEEEELLLPRYFEQACAAV